MRTGSPTAASSPAASASVASQRAVGFVNFDPRATRDNKRPSVIFLQKHEQFGRPTASLVLHGIPQRYSGPTTLCNVPHTVMQHYVQQVHMSSTGEYMSFSVCDAQNPDAVPKMPMLFHRTGTDLRACDHFIDHGQDLNGDTLLSFYFPQFTNVGDLGVTWVVAVCRAQSGARNVHLVKLQHPDKASFFSGFSLFKGRSRRVGAHSVRHVPGTDFILTSTRKPAPSHHDRKVRHLAVHAVAANESIQRLFEVQLAEELSEQLRGEQMLSGHVFFEGNAQDEIKFAREAAAAGKSAVPSQRISCVVVANVLYEQGVKATFCGAHVKEVQPQSSHMVSSLSTASQQQNSEYVWRNVVRLFVFRPRGTYQGQDYYIDLYFEKKNIVVFQLSALGQMVVLSPGHKAYFVDVKYFHPLMGPTVSFRLYLDGAMHPQSYPGPKARPIPGADATAKFVDPAAAEGSPGLDDDDEDESAFDATTAAPAGPQPNLPDGSPCSPTSAQLPFEEAPFLGDRLPQCFLRSSGVLAHLPPMEVPCGDAGRFILFFSAHTSAVLSLESRFPVWAAAQQSLLRDRLRKTMQPADRCHDGEFSARGLLTCMDRVVMSLAGRSGNSSGGGGGGAGGGAIVSGSGIGNNNNSSFSFSPRLPQDRARAMLDEDTAAAMKVLVPAFRAFATRMRDPVGLCLEWVIAAAYFRLGWRHSAPPRLAFDMSAYEGLIHPYALPRTTQHVRGTTVLMNTFVVDCASCAASSNMSGSGGGGGSPSKSDPHTVHSSLLPGWSVRVHPRDELVKAIENRIDESIPGRETLIRTFREFDSYEEEILETICPALVHDVRLQLYPLSAAMGRNSSREFPRSGTGGNSRAVDQQQQQPSPTAGAAAGAAAAAAAAEDGVSNSNNNNVLTGPLARRIPSVPEPLRRVNELSFLMCRLTALEIIGVRLDRERAAPMFSTTIVFFAAENRILPFCALARALWLRAITNQTDATSTVLLSPLSQFANGENRRLNLLVTQGAHVAQRRRRFMPMVNPTSVALAPFGGGSSSRAMSWAPTSADQGWDDDFTCHTSSRSAKKFLRRLKKKYSSDVAP